MYLFILPKKRWIYSKNHFIKPVDLEKPTIASIAIVSKEKTSTISKNFKNKSTIKALSLEALLLVIKFG